MCAEAKDGANLRGPGEDEELRHLKTRKDGSSPITTGVPMLLQYLITFMFPALLLLGAAYDLAAYRIPNWVCAAMAAAFLPVAILSGMSFGAIGFSLLIGIAMLLVGMVLFALKWVGGGDAKMLAAAALWVGIDKSGSMFGVLNYVVAAGLIGGVFALLLLSYRRMPLPATFAGQPWLMRLHSASEGIPYGVALAGAGIWVFQNTTLYAHLVS